jgi:hypothetical protein
MRGGGIDTAITLATLKPTDNVESLIGRIVREVAPGCATRRTMYDGSHIGAKVCL